MKERRRTSAWPNILIQKLTFYINNKNRSGYFFFFKYTINESQMEQIDHRNNEARGGGLIQCHRKH